MWVEELSRKRSEVRESASWQAALPAVCRAGQGIKKSSTTVQRYSAEHSGSLGVHCQRKASAENDRALAQERNPRSSVLIIP